MPRKKKFPLAIKSGSSVVRIYRDGDYYRLSYYLGGRRHRQTFSDLEQAKSEANAKAAQLARGDLDAAQLTGKDRLIYGRVLDAIRPLGIPLEAAAVEYAEAKKILEGVSLTEAARFYMLHHKRGIEDKLVKDAVQEFRQAKWEAGKSPLYIKDIDYRLGRLASSFSVEVRQLTPQDVAAFLKSLDLRARGFNNFVMMLRTFFRFCQSRGWLSREVDLLAMVEKRTGTASEIEIFTPDELRKLLAASPGQVATCIALQAFSGIRTAELFRLTWKDVERRNGHIEIAAGKAKTASRRLIPVCENLEQWIRQAARQGERVWPATASEYYSQKARAANAAGIDWKANGLRHSFITYRLAQTKDVAEVGLEAGNSATMIFRHYRELATEAEAKEWFGILPPRRGENVVQFAA